ncbi:MAG: hypothetical protein EAZ80_10580 [Runella slithyformis]|nr:MAG: hypothetical protein EAZ80_10580 [Runella slithyformis]
MRLSSVWTLTMAWEYENALIVSVDTDNGLENALIVSVDTDNGLEYENALIVSVDTDNGLVFMA